MEIGPPAKIFFFQISIVFFPSLFKFDVLFQDQLKEYTGEDYIIDMIHIIIL